jgi:hypothetical protein
MGENMFTHLLMTVVTAAGMFAGSPVRADPALDCGARPSDYEGSFTGLAAVKKPGGKGYEAPRTIRILPSKKAVLRSGGVDAYAGRVTFVSPGIFGGFGWKVPPSGRTPGGDANFYFPTCAGGGSLVTSARYDFLSGDRAQTYLIRGVLVRDVRAR